VKIFYVVLGAVFAFLAISVTFPVVPILLFAALPSFDDLRYDDALVQRLRVGKPPCGTVSTPCGLVRGADVTAAIADVFPIGMGADHAARYLKANGFACAAAEATSNADGRLDCKRDAGRIPCSETWIVRVFLGRDRTVVDRHAKLDVVCW
jgi:hypothetical protein